MLEYSPTVRWLNVHLLTYLSKEKEEMQRSIYTHTHTTQSYIALHCIALQCNCMIERFKRPGAADPLPPRYRNFSCPLKAGPVWGWLTNLATLAETSPAVDWHRDGRRVVASQLNAKKWKKFGPESEEQSFVAWAPPQLVPKPGGDYTLLHVHSIHCEAPRCNFVWRIM